jgi:ribosomal protein L40E
MTRLRKAWATIAALFRPLDPPSAEARICRSCKAQIGTNPDTCKECERWEMRPL